MNPIKILFIHSLHTVLIMKLVSLICDSILIHIFHLTPTSNCNLNSYNLINTIRNCLIQFGHPFRKIKVSLIYYTSDHYFHLTLISNWNFKFYNLMNATVTLFIHFCQRNATWCFPGFFRNKIFLKVRRAVLWYIYRSIDNICIVLFYWKTYIENLCCMYFLILKATGLVYFSYKDRFSMIKILYLAESTF